MSYGPRRLEECGEWDQVGEEQGVLLFSERACAGDQDWVDAARRRRRSSTRELKLTKNPPNPFTSLPSHFNTLFNPSSTLIDNLPTPPDPPVSTSSPSPPAPPSLDHSPLLEGPEEFVFCGRLPDPLEAEGETRGSGRVEASELDSRPSRVDRRRASAHHPEFTL